MDINAGIVIGIATMFFWGLADIFAKPTVQKIGVTKSIFARFAITIPFLFFLSFFVTDFTPPKNNIFLISLASLFNLLGFVFYYKSIKKGSLSIAAPIVSCNGVIVVLMSVFFLDEVLSYAQGFLIGLIFLGVFFISARFSEIKGTNIQSPKDIFFAFLSMLFWGFSLFLSAIIIKNYDILLTFLFFNIFGLFYIIIFLVINNKNGFNKRLIKNKIKDIFSKNKIKSNKNLFYKVLALLVLTSLCEAFGFLGYSLGAIKGIISIVMPIASAFPLIVIIFARIFFKERMELNQIFGAFLIITGVVFLN